MGTETREVWIVANLDGEGSVCEGSQSVFATEAEADADVEDRLEEAMDQYAWSYDEDELKAVPAGEDDCIDSLTHDYVPRDGNDQTNMQLLEVMERDHVSAWSADLSFEDINAFVEDEDAAREIWKLAGGYHPTHLASGEVSWPLLKTFADKRGIIRVWLYSRNLSKCWVVTADSQGNNHTAYQRGYHEAKELFDHFAQEAIDSQEPHGEGSIAE